MPPAHRAQISAALLQAGQQLYDSKLMAAHDGNLSYRLADGTFLITASGISKGGMTVDDLLTVDAQGQVLQCASGRAPSSELALHLGRYAALPEIQCVIHAHPPFATALACAGRPFDAQIVEEARLLLGAVPTIPYAPAGSTELADRVAAAAPGHHALLLANHGAVSWGETVEQALFRLEALEHSTRIMLYVRFWQREADHV